MITDESIYQRYLRRRGQCRRSVGGKIRLICLTLYINGYIKDIHEAEDLMIEAFSKIFAKERPIAGNGSFKAYLYKTARNLALRHKRKTPPSSFSRIDDLDFEPPGKMLADDQRSLRKERDRQLYAALDKLKPEYREACIPHLPGGNELPERGSGHV